MRALAGLLCAWVVCGAGFAQAYEREFQDWAAVQTDRETHIALTQSDDEAVFGQVCLPKRDACLWLVTFDSACKSGDSYSALINSDAGAQAVNLICDGRLDSGQYRYFLDDFDSIDNLVRNSSRLGIAIPLEGDEFLVLRFSMRGAGRAVDFMRSQIQNAPRGHRSGNRPPQRRKGDERM